MVVAVLGQFLGSNAQKTGVVEEISPRHRTVVSKQREKEGARERHDCIQALPVTPAHHAPPPNSAQLRTHSWMNSWMSTMLP